MDGLSINEVAQYIQESALFALRVGDGHFEGEIAPLNESDILRNALNAMSRKLHVAYLKEQKIKAEMQGLVNITAIIDAEETIDGLSKAIANAMVEMLHLHSVALLAVSDPSSSYKVYDVRAALGYPNINIQKRVTQEHLSVKVLLQSNAPKLSFNQPIENSIIGLGTQAMGGRMHFMLMPLSLKGVMYGVLEIVSNSPFSSEQMKFPRLAAEKIATALMRIKALEQMQLLLNEAQTLAEELQQREDNLYALNLAISKQHARLSESINYASQIQHAIIPSAKLLQATFPDSFFINLPKDRVGGDFPWLRQQGSYFYMAAADCTGHGVAGALIAFICYFMLNEIVEAEEDLLPNVILDKLDQRLSRLLKDSEQFGRQISIDIALCRYMPQHRQLDFASAHRPLLLHTTNGIETIKGDRKNIGTHHATTTFTLHSFILKPNEAFYLYSDGYVDQFGGKADQKFSSKRLKELLSSCGELSMQKVGEKLYDAHFDWKGHRIQTDDILVLGIRP